MKYILRATRWLVALIVSAHVACLRSHCKLADRKVAKSVKNVDYARALLAASQDTVRHVRQQLRSTKNDHIIVIKDAANVRIAADAEAKFWGRDL